MKTSQINKAKLKSNLKLLLGKRYAVKVEPPKEEPKTEIILVEKKGDQGPRGKRGPRGRKGVRGDKGDTVEGPPGPPGNKGDQGDRGLTPIEGVDYVDLRKHPEYIYSAVEGLIEKIGEATAPYLVKLITSAHVVGLLTKVDPKSEEGRLLKSYMASGGFNMNDQRWHGAGTGGGGGFNSEAPLSGAIDGSNTIFIFAHTPKAVVLNGLYYFENNGYTLAGSTVTFTPDYTPATGSVLRSIY